MCNREIINRKHLSLHNYSTMMYCLVQLYSTGKKEIHTIVPCSRQKKEELRQVLRRNETILVGNTYFSYRNRCI